MEAIVTTGPPPPLRLLTLPDGRRLACAEYGDPNGLPVLALHGTPGSRLMFALADGAARLRGIRLIAPERPGYGLSDYRSSETLARIAEDLSAVADTYGLDRFAIIGDFTYLLLGASKSGARSVSLDRLFNRAVTRYTDVRGNPRVTPVTSNAASIARFTRSSVLEVVSQDYVRTARAKGLREQTVVLFHAVRNAMIPVITIIALQIPEIFGGAIITEQIFKVPGIGSALILAIGSGDTPTVMAITFGVAILVVIFNVLADVVYAVLDPRIKLS